MTSKNKNVKDERESFSVTPAKGSVEKVRNTVEGYFFVTPVKTGVQKLIDTILDSRLRGNDMDNGIRLYCFFKGFFNSPEGRGPVFSCERQMPTSALLKKGKETTLYYKEVNP